MADTPERLAKRTDRLRRYQAGGSRRWAPVIVPAEPESESEAESMTEAESAAAVEQLERVINDPDFVDIRFLEAGVAAARAVGRINIRNQAGRVVGYGTASLVSTQLILTNHHVLPTADVARWSAVEFNYQDGIDGQPLQPRVFRLDPERFYLADKEYDFAFVAVDAGEGELAEFGFNRLADVEGNALVGEFVTIVQHPKGEKKQVSLRENRVVDLLDSFIHYETDTEPGSSGSPVFNDQWEVVALHHASVPAPDHAELGHIMNEGIRITTVIKAATTQAAALPVPTRQLLDGLFDDERSAVGTVAPTPVAAPTPIAMAQRPVSQMPVSPMPVADPTPMAVAAMATTGPQSIRSVDSPRWETAPISADGIRLTVPVEIFLRLGPAPSDSWMGLGSPTQHPTQYLAGPYPSVLPAT